MNDKLNGSDKLTLGVLGCGYVGQRLLGTLNWSPSSWYTVHQHDPVLNYPSVDFSLDDPQSWSQLPLQADVLLLTIAPKYQDRAEEKARLSRWCQWMADNRPALKRLIYISTTGVYSEQPGTYHEHSETCPDLLRGWLRLDSELLLAQYFDCVNLRCGGIYGPDSNMVDKIRAGQPLFAGNKPMYRIHIDDLVGVINAVANQLNAGLLPSNQRQFNLVDDQAVGQDEIIDWLLIQPQLKAVATKVSFKDKRLDAPADHDPRTIVNDALLTVLGYQLQYPDYRQGLMPLL